MLHHMHGCSSLFMSWTWNCLHGLLLKQPVSPGMGQEIQSKTCAIPERTMHAAKDTAFMSAYKDAAEDTHQHQNKGCRGDPVG